jgi:gas vesicle protein
MRKFTGYFIGTIAGAVIFSGLVLLFAPVSGKELRQRIKTKYLDLEAEFKLASQERRAELETELSNLRKGLPSGK